MGNSPVRHKGPRFQWISQNAKLAAKPKKHKKQKNKWKETTKEGKGRKGKEMKFPSPQDGVHLEDF